MSTVTLRRAAIAASLALVISACSDEDRDLPGEPQFTEPGIHPVLVVAAQNATTATMRLELKRVAVAEKIASFQGEISYDTTQMRLTDASVPARITGAWNEVRPGTVRFTGLAVSGIDSGAVLTLQFAATRPVAAEALSLKMEEIVADDFADLKPKLRRSPRGAVLVRAPLFR
jgi:hypothetical protein